MSNHNKISLQSAILMNINIMAGAGIFINIALLTQHLQLFGGSLYFIIGCFMFPLIFTFAQLVQRYPSGGFYAFAQPISPLLGFVSCWSYFFGKLGSAALYLTVISRMLIALFPNVFGSISPFIISLAILALFLYFNCQNMKIGVIIQKFFVSAKVIPMLILIGLGVYHFDINIFNQYPFNVPYLNFVLMLPSVLYCFSGFEAACSISRNIENASVNAPKAIFYSFLSVIVLYIGFQTLISMMLMPNIENISGYSEAYPYLMSLMPCSPFMQAKLATLMSLTIGFSAIGAAYGILFSNSWNLYTLAEHNHTFAATTLAQLNKHNIPHYTVLVEGAFCTLFLLLSNGNPITLQQISTLGGVITYSISTIAFLYSSSSSRLMGWLSLGTCTGLFIACIISMLKYSTGSLYLFIGLISLGIAMYWANQK
nr:amino acid permease [Candidatus Babeliales bacterium]